MSDAARTDPESLPLIGAVDGDLRLISADDALYALQEAAGGKLGQKIAIPQLAAVTREAVQRNRTLRRAIIAASEQEDLELHVKVTPETGGGAAITIEEWHAKPRGLAQFNREPKADFRVDPRLRITQIEPGVARRFGIDLETLPRPLTELVNLVARRDGSLPFLDALSNEAAFDRQRATVKSRDFPFAFAGRPLRDGDGNLTSYAMTILNTANPAEVPQETLDATLRSPLSRIIDAADQIVDRSDGPLRSDYANYAGDIATAGRHLLSVIRTMSGSIGTTPGKVDLASLAREAASMASADAREAGVDIEIEEYEGSLDVIGEKRGILQILVNIMGNAIRHSPGGGTVAIVFDAEGDRIAVTIADQGPGIDRADQARIFEQYERLGQESDQNAGLGLAISRRLARSMRGDISIDSAKGEGARFTLKLPRAS